MRRALAMMLTAAALSTGYACETPAPQVPMYEPRARSERVEWRSDVGIEAARAYVLSDCASPNSLEERFARYGEQYGLSARDVAESVFWGVLKRPYELDVAPYPTLDEFLHGTLDEHGEPIVETLDIMFGDGEYDQLIPWWLYGWLKEQFTVEDTEQLRDRLPVALTVASWFADLESMYDELKASTSR